LEVYVKFAPQALASNIFKIVLIYNYKISNNIPKGVGAMKKGNKSAEIRRLYDLGLSVQEIATTLGIRYQFAYNVVSHYARSKSLARQPRVEVAAAAEALPAVARNSAQTSWFRRWFAR